MRTRAIAVMCLLLHLLWAGRTGAQQLQAKPERNRVTVGDAVAVDFSGSVDPGSSLVDRVPRPLDSLPQGLRILAVGSFTSSATGEVRGRLRVAFFQPGSQTIPPLLLVYRTPEGADDSALSRPVPVEVTPVLPPGNQEIKDVREFAPRHRDIRPLWWGVLIAGGLLSLVFWWRGRRVRARQSSGEVHAASTPPSAYDRAWARLAEIEAAQWPERGEVFPHYEQVTEVLRRYLEDAGIAALERTTTELVWSLPPALSADGRREQCHELLRQADLVKFAGLCPSPEAADRFLQGARRLLTEWHRTFPVEEVTPSAALR